MSALFPKPFTFKNSGRFSDSFRLLRAFPQYKHSGILHKDHAEITAAGTVQDSHLFPSRGLDPSPKIRNKSKKKSNPPNK